MKLQWDIPAPNIIQRIISGDLRIIGKADYWLIKDWKKGYNILRVEFSDPGDPKGTDEEHAVMQNLLLIAEHKVADVLATLPPKPPRGFE